MLDANAILLWAAESAGLASLVDDGMRQRFSGMIAGFNTNGDVPVAALPKALDDFRTLITHRLMVERDLRAYPEIALETVERPVFIVGLPRTGTTILQCLLGQDPGSRILHYWHSHFPSPPPGTAPGTVGERIRPTDKLVEALVALMPQMLACHPYLDQGGLAELEDEELFTLDFQSTFPFHFTNVPTVPVGAAPRDARGAFQFHKRMLQYFQWKLPRKRWVCKGTTHQFFLEALFDVYPDATCIWPHRDPSEFVASCVKMIDVLFGPITGRDYRPFADVLISEIRGGYDAVLRSPEIDDPRIIHVPFAELMKDQVGTIKQIYQRAGLKFSTEFKQGITAWLKDPGHRSDRYGRFEYSAEEFGLSAADIKIRFSDYRERFQLA